MKKILLSLIALGTMGIVAKGQISLKQSDFPQAGTTTERYTIYNTGTLSDSVSIGNGANAESYDFVKLANMATNETREYNFIAASSSPYAANHTGANIAFIGDMEMDGSDTILIGWRFMKVDANSATIIGVTYEVDTAALINGDPPKGRDIIGHATYSSPEIWVNTSFAKSYTTSSVSHTSLTIPGMNLKHSESYYRDIEVDGYGKLKHPNFPNSDIDVLRVKVRLEEWNRDSVMSIETDNNRDTMYSIEYWGLEYGMPIVTVRTSSSYQDVWEITYSDIQEVHTSVARLNPADFNLYPNPANGYTTIDFGKALEVDYTLKVYNSLGQMVTGLDVQAGTDNVQIDVSTLAKGTYYIALEGLNGEKALTKKLVVE